MTRLTTDRVNQLAVRDTDMRQRRTVNAAPSVDKNDYTIQAELTAAVTAARAELAAAVAKLEASLSALARLDFVYGGANLTTVGKLPKVSAVGTLTQSSLSDDGTNVSGTEPLHLDTGATPQNSQVVVKANAAAALSVLTYAVDNVSVGFDVERVANVWTARDASICLVQKNGAQLKIYGSTGNTPGSAAAITLRATIDLATGDIDAVTGGYKAGGTAGESTTLTYLTGTPGVGQSSKTTTFTKGIETSHT